MAAACCVVVGAGVGVARAFVVAVGDGKTGGGRRVEVALSCTIMGGGGGVVGAVGGVVGESADIGVADEDAREGLHPAMRLGADNSVKAREMSCKRDKSVLRMKDYLLSKGK